MTSQPVLLFLHILFESLFEDEVEADTITQLFDSGIPEEHADFGKGLSHYLLTKFYLRIKNKYKKKGEKKLPPALETKIKAAFDIIKKKTDDEFLAHSLRSKL